MKRSGLRARPMSEGPRRSRTPPPDADPGANDFAERDYTAFDPRTPEERESGAIEAVPTRMAPVVLKDAPLAWRDDEDARSEFESEAATVISQTDVPAVSTTMDEIPAVSVRTTDARLFRQELAATPRRLRDRLNVPMVAAAAAVALAAGVLGWLWSAR